jgi:hypothetical protein
MKKSLANYDVNAGVRRFDFSLNGFFNYGSKIEFE